MRVPLGSCNKAEGTDALQNGAQRGWLVAARLIGDICWYEAVHSLTIALGVGLQQYAHSHIV